VGFTNFVIVHSAPASLVSGRGRHHRFGRGRCRWPLCHTFWRLGHQTSERLLFELSVAHVGSRAAVGLRAHAFHRRVDAAQLRRQVAHLRPANRAPAERHIANAAPSSPVDRLVLEAAHHDLVQTGVHVGQQRRREATLRDVLGQLHHVQVELEVGLGAVGERLPEEHTEGPDVAGRRPRPAREALGRHPLERQCCRRLQLVAAPRVVLAAQPKVAHLQSGASVTSGSARISPPLPPWPQSFRCRACEPARFLQRSVQKRATSVLSSHWRPSPGG